MYASNEGGAMMAEAEAIDVRYCVNHPAVETVVTCGRCEKPRRPVTPPNTRLAIRTGPSAMTSLP